MGERAPGTVGGAGSLKGALGVKNALRLSLSNAILNTSVLRARPEKRNSTESGVSLFFFFSLSHTHTQTHTHTHQQLPQLGTAVNPFDAVLPSRKIVSVLPSNFTENVPGVDFLPLCWFCRSCSPAPQLASCGYNCKIRWSDSVICRVGRLDQVQI